MNQQVACHTLSEWEGDDIQARLVNQAQWLLLSLPLFLCSSLSLSLSLPLCVSVCVRACMCVCVCVSFLSALSSLSLSLHPSPSLPLTLPPGTRLGTVSCCVCFCLSIPHMHSPSLPVSLSAHVSASLHHVLLLYHGNVPSIEIVQVLQSTHKEHAKQFNMGHAHHTEGDVHGGSLAPVYTVKETRRQSKKNPYTLLC